MIMNNHYRGTNTGWQSCFLQSGFHKNFGTESLVSLCRLQTPNSRVYLQNKQMKLTILKIKYFAYVLY